MVEPAFEPRSNFKVHVLCAPAGCLWVAPWEPEAVELWKLCLVLVRTQTSSPGGRLCAHWGHPHPVCVHRALLPCILLCCLLGIPTDFSEGCSESCLTKTTRWRSVGHGTLTPGSKAQSVLGDLL